MFDSNEDLVVTRTYAGIDDALLKRYRSMNALFATLLDFSTLISCLQGPLVISHACVKGTLTSSQVSMLLTSIFSALDLHSPFLQKIDQMELGSCVLLINQRIKAALDAGDTLEFTDNGDFLDFLEHLPTYVKFYRSAIHFSGVAVERLIVADGAALRVYRSVEKKQHTVVIVLPCAMPFPISRDWFSYLSQDYNVITWETRCAFDDPMHACEVRLDFNSQADDLLALIQHYCIEAPHVMGICGGAVVAMNAARRSAAPFAGLSLWYGDYNFDSEAMQTPYQKNLRWMMDTAGEGLESAETVFDLFDDPAMLKNVDAHHASSILCPFASVPSLHRYAMLNGSIMSANITELALETSMFVSVISSDGDQTAHPEGSRRVAELLEHSQLHMEADSDHLSFFSANDSHRRIASECIENGFQKQ